MRRLRLALFPGVLFGSMALLTTPALARSCGSASCPLSTVHQLRAGWMTVGLSHEYILQDRIHVGSSLSAVGAIPEEHDEIQTLNEKNTLLLQLGILDRLSLQLDLPFVHREHAHISHEGSVPKWESFNFSGLGDAALTAHLRVTSDGSTFAPSISLDAGVKSSSGVTDLRNADGEKGEVTIQPGTGSVDAVVGVRCDQNIGTVPMIVNGYTLLSMSAGATVTIPGTGSDGYRFGTSVVTHLGASYQALERALVLLQVNGRFQGYAEVGSTGEPRENTGGTWIFLSPGLGLQMTDELSASAYVQFPVYQDVHGIQQTARYNLFMSVSYQFDLTGNATE